VKTLSFKFFLYPFQEYWVPSTIIKNMTSTMNRTDKKKKTNTMHYINRYELTHVYSKTQGERADSDDLRECPLSSLTAKDAVRARQPSSLHTPSHLRVWLVLHTGNWYRKKKRGQVHNDSD
jgi:hypothetical protein